jgi:hypothetical protein
MHVLRRSVETAVQSCLSLHLRECLLHGIAPLKSVEAFVRRDDI